MKGKTRFLQVGVVWLMTLAVGSIATLAVAGSSSTTLPNGAQLSVSVDDPVTCTEFQVPAADPDDAIDVQVQGTASVGLGEPDATLVYVVDVSGSTDVGSGTGCAPILDCEQEFIKALNQAAISDGSVDEVGVVVYADSANTADMSPDGGDQTIVAPDADSYVNTVVDSTYSDAMGGNGGVAQYSNKAVGQFTNCEAALQSALAVVNASTNGTNLVIFTSDGLCNTGGTIADEVADLASVGAVIYSVAVGTGSDCDSDPASLGTLRDMADGTGGTCFEVSDPGNLPDIIPSLIGSTLESLEIEVDGGGQVAIPNADIDPDLPQPGAVSGDYDTTVAGLGPADHEICVTANGSDVTGGTADVTQCETIHLLQLTASPETETNELNFDNGHTVTAEIVGGSGPTRDIDFLVGGQNAGTADPASDSIPADPNVAVDFVYTVPQECASLGTDTVTVSTVIAGVEDSIVLEKEWIDTVPPEVSCDPTVNPHGKKEPQAPGTGQNEDGFYQLNAEDPVLDCPVVLTVTDGDGYVFPGPFAPGDNIKYTQASSPQQQKKIGSAQGQAGAVLWHLIGHGDLSVTGTDTSGNSATAMCLVPPPPK